MNNTERNVNQLVWDLATSSNCAVKLNTCLTPVTHRSELHIWKYTKFCLWPVWSYSAKATMSEINKLKQYMATALKSQQYSNLNWVLSYDQAAHFRTCQLRTGHLLGIPDTFRSSVLMDGLCNRGLKCTGKFGVVNTTSLWKTHWCAEEMYHYRTQN